MSKKGHDENMTMTKKGHQIFEKKMTSMTSKKGHQNFRRKNCKSSRMTELRHFFNPALTTVV